MIVAGVTPNPQLKIKMYREEKHHDYPTNLRNHLLQFSPTNLKPRKLKVDHETETKTIRLTSQIIRCIAKSLFGSAEGLERSLWHYSTPTEHSQLSSVCDDGALSL
jgi:hypothetical protein